MRTNIPYTNFASGQLSYTLNGKVDLPLYRNGVELMENFYTNVQGNAIYRSGFEYISGTKDNLEARLIEFKFNKEQAYILEFTAGTIKFLTYDASGNFGYVQSGGGDLEVVNPYTSIEDIKALQFAQKDDVVYFVSPDYEPYKLTRVSATSFTFATYTRTTDPFGGSNWPRSVCFYEGRLIYGGATDEPTTIFGSQSGDYDDMTTGTDDDDGFEFTIAEISESIEWGISGTNSLILGTAEGCVAVNGGSVDTALTPTTVNAKLVNQEGCDPTYPIKKDGFIIYVELGGRKARAFNYDILTETFKASNMNIANYDLTIGGMSGLVYRKDKYDLVYSVRNDGALLGATFNKDESVNGWAQQTTNGEFLSISQLTRDDGDFDLIACVKRNINGSDVYYIERLGGYVDYLPFSSFYTGEEEDDRNNYKRYIAEALKANKTLDASSCLNRLQDNSITFDGVDTITATSSVFTADDVGNQIWYKTVDGTQYGRFDITGYTSGTVVTVEVIEEPHANTYDSWYLTFNSLSGLTHLEGEEVGVFADGGYLGDYTVTSGEIELNREVSSLCVGLKYTGVIKSFNLGLLGNGITTQTTRKEIYKAVIRFNYSAGGKFGSSRYELEPIQEFSVSGNYDQPPLPMNFDVTVSYQDNYDEEKSYVIVQDEPVPMIITMVVPYFTASTQI